MKSAQVLATGLVTLLLLGQSHAFFNMFGGRGGMMSMFNPFMMGMMGFGGFGGGEEMMMLGCITNPNCMSNPMMSMGMLSGSSDTMRNMIMFDQARKGRVDPLLMT